MKLITKHSKLNLEDKLLLRQTDSSLYLEVATSNPDACMRCLLQWHVRNQISSRPESHQIELAVSSSGSESTSHACPSHI